MYFEVSKETLFNWLAHFTYLYNAVTAHRILAEI